MKEPLGNWIPPSDWTRLEVLDAHTEGEPLRVVVSGYPDLPGATILERRRFAREHLDHLRRALMLEPRGHADMYGCVITPAVTDGADFGVLFLHNEGYSTMCGHGIIGVVTVALQTGMIAPRSIETRVRIDTPAGLVTAYGRMQDKLVESVRFLNVPSYVVGLDEVVEVPGIGKVRYDLAFGGAYYAFVDAGSLGLRCAPENAGELIRAAMGIKKELMRSRPIEHPFETDLGFLYGVILLSPPEDPANHSRHVCVFAGGQIDRSPTGTGVSARAAILHARGDLAGGESIVIESIVGSSFRVGVNETTSFGPYPAVIPEVEGRAFLTGRNQLWIDPRDPLRDGFVIR